MTAVPAGVRERPDLSVLAPHEQRAAVPGLDRELVADCGQPRPVGRARPAAAEEVPSFPVEYLR